MIKRIGPIAAAISLAIAATPAVQASEISDPQPPPESFISASTLGSSTQNVVVRVDEHPDPIVIDGKEFGDAEGLIRVQVTGVVGPNGAFPVLASPGEVQPLGWAPYYNTTITWGTSWVRNEEIAYLWYRGATRAGGNVYNGKRIIRTTLKYRRDGKILGTAESNAKYRSGAWTQGDVTYTNAWDSPYPNAAQTQFYYDYLAVAPNTTG